MVQRKQLKNLNMFKKKRKKEREKEKKGRKKARKQASKETSSFGLANDYLYFSWQCNSLINCLLHVGLPVGSRRSSLASSLAHYFQMYNAIIVSKCFGKKDLERNCGVLTKIEICNKTK